MQRKQANGGTDLYGGVMRALKINNVDTIVLLSDGMPSAGKVTDPTQILSMIQQLNTYKGIRIHTIYLSGSSSARSTLGGAARFLKALADQNNGSFSLITQ